MLLAFFLGTLGIHNFYLHHEGHHPGADDYRYRYLRLRPWALIDFIMLIMRSGSYATALRASPAVTLWVVVAALSMRQSSHAAR